MLISFRVHVDCCLASLMLLLSGCGGEELPNGPRVAVSPVTGQIIVDAEPCANLAITCHPVGEKTDSLPTSSAFTNNEGKFEIGTFEAGDGVPPGEYKLTFMWGQINLMSGSYGGPDKLKGRYSDPEKSEHIITVKDGEALDLGDISLTTK